MEATSREIRVFLSSTFRDMQAERDYLVKFVFPEIRAACRSRHVQFTDIDLRWGLTREEAEQGKVVAICLDEIEKCRPYFIGFIGERYGWSPTDSDLNRKSELISRFPVVEQSLKEQLSVTEMEIRHGVLDNPTMATHSFFYFRSYGLSRKLLVKSKTSRNDYFESDELCNAKLIRLKDQIRSRHFPLLDGYASIEEFGNKVRQDLLGVLETRFPTESLPTRQDIERTAHEAYAESRCHAYVPDPEVLNTLDNWIRDATQSQSPLVITGPSGMGKSSLVAYWTTKTELPANFHSINHYVGSSSDPTPARILARLMEEIGGKFNLRDPLPEDAENIVKQFPEWLARIPAGQNLLIVIDGLNQIDTDHVQWLPEFWPENVRTVLTVTPGRLLEQCRNRSWQVLLNPPLDQTRRRMIVSSFLAHYRKSLSVEQVQMLVSAPQTDNPLYLRILLEELRVFGSFDDLTPHLQSLLGSRNPSELYQLLLARLEQNLGETHVRSTLSHIWAARKGLNESEIQELTGIKRLDLSRLLNVFEYHLSRKGGELNFFHDFLRHAVGARYLKSPSSPTRAHRKLANYFNTRCVDERTVEELPWQWQQAKSPINLQSCLTRRGIFEGLYSKAPHDLSTFWEDCRGKPGHSYRRVIKTWLSETTSPNEVASTAQQVTRFLAANCADYPSATYVANWAFRKIPDSAKYALCNIWQTLGFAYRMQGKFLKARRAYETAASIADAHIDLLNPIETATLLTGIARLQRATGDQLDSAVGQYELSLSLMTHQNPAAIGPLAMIKAELASAQKACGKFEAAVTNYEAARSDLTKLHGNDYLELAEILNALGDLWEDRQPPLTDRLEKAEAFYRLAMNIRERRLGTNHPTTAASLNNLARIAQKKGDLRQGLELASKALQIRQGCLPANHPDIATSLNQVARSKAKLGMFNDAEADYRNAIAICVASFGEIHRRTLRNIEELSMLFIAADKPKDAQALEKRARRIRESAQSAGITIS